MTLLTALCFSPPMEWEGSITLWWSCLQTKIFGTCDRTTTPPHLVRVYQVHSWIWASRPTVEGFIKYFISALLCCEWVCDVEIVTFCHFNFLEPWQTFYWQLEALATGCVVHALKLSVSHSGNLGQPAAGSVSALILFNCSTMGWQVSRLNLDVMSVNVYDGHLM